MHFQRCLQSSVIREFLASRLRKACLTASNVEASSFTCSTAKGASSFRLFTDGSQIRFLARYSAKSKMKLHNKEFCFNNYDAIGFDLDGTLLRYNLNEMIPLEYELLRDFLVHKKGYPKTLLQQKINLDFIQKGLVLDAKNGNILKLSSSARILRATHGTKLLTQAQFESTYGVNCEWDVSTQFFKDPLSTWNGPLSEKLRTLLDYFDLAVSLVFAQTVDALDAAAITEGHPGHMAPYNVWPDILEGLILMYTRDNFANGQSAYFSSLRAEPDRYLLRVNSPVLQWLRDLRSSGKAVFLLTGSNIDFANFTASYALGADWQDYFDCVVCFAKKPGFFTQQRPYLRVVDNAELQGGEINLTAELPINATYTQGNWHQLQAALAKKVGKSVNETRYLYLGDNLIQDVYTSVKHHDFDAVAFCEELLAEEQHDERSYEFQQVVGSSFWGSYFSVDNQPTLWASIISEYSKLCIPLMDCVVKAPITHNYCCENPQGYFPKAPLTLKPLQ